MFAKGQSGNPKGRKPGTPNRATRTVRETFEAVFVALQSSDKANLLVWAEENPTDFYRLSAKLIPLQVRAEADDKVAVSALEVAAKVSSLLALARAREAEASAA
jgi:hypothetical protein